MPASRPVCRRRWDLAGSVTLAACHRRASSRTPATICPLLSERRSRSAALMGTGVREIAWASGSFSVDDLPRTAPERSDRGGQLVYRAVIAQWHRDRRARRPKTAKLAANDTYRRAAARRKLTRRIRTLVRFWMGDPSARQ
jgi:hypothetical protein